MSLSEGLVWVPDTDEIFRKARVVSVSGDSVKVKYEGSSKTASFNKSQLQKCNPASFEKCDDMASLTYLNEPSVINTLKLRFGDDMIYTYSGLFLVAVNPYKPVNIYNGDFVELYKNARNQLADREGSVVDDTNSNSTTSSIRALVPPHIFGISEEAYQYLLRDKQDQSILVTGESGAGKTENTKKVIQYVLSVSSTSTENLESKIMEANPILESFGNATTVRNLNSSRFGKFVKINVVPKTQEVTGAHIDWYLLEKSRVVLQEENERNYHVFYQLLKGASKEVLKQLHLAKSISHYSYLEGSDGVSSSINDEQEFRNLEKAFDVMGFNAEDKLNIYRILSIILHLGNITFRDPSNDSRQAMLTEDSEMLLGTIADLLSTSTTVLHKSLLKSKVMAGREVVTKQRTASQAKFAIDALSKSLYERLFQFLVDKVNENFDSSAIFTMQPANYIGILDIAGFEIFKKNSFEQLCINYTNEKLQQFFNHHMFVLEQSEYLKEGISWQYIDFGHELKPTIELIEGTSARKCNIFSILDEECVVPKGSDRSFLDKLFDELETKDKKADKSELSFKPNKVRDGFVVKHYAGEVDYSIDGWLDKNKDPLSSSMVEMLSQSKNAFISDMFDANTDNDKLTSNLSDSPVKGGAVKRRRTGIFRTVAQRHREQLTDLMQQLGETHPHFVRCILPNNDKAPSKFENKLVLDQLRCNGVLEGIRIARSGYPNRIGFEKFAKLYSLLVKGAVTEGRDYKRICEHILKDMDLDDEVYKVGLTKLFFRNGVLASIEKVKEARLAEIMTQFQAVVRGSLTRTKIQRRIIELRAAKTIVQNFQNYSELSRDPWYKLISQLKPTVMDADSVESHYIGKIQQLEQQVTKLTSQIATEEATRKELQGKYDSLDSSVKSDRDLLSTKDKSLGESKKRVVELEKLIQEKNEEIEKLTDAEQNAKDLEQAKEKLEKELLEAKESNASLKEEVSNLKSDIAKKEQELAETKSALDSNHDEMKESVRETKSQLKELAAQNKMLEESLHSKEANEKILKKDLADAKRDLADSKSIVSTIPPEETDKLKSRYKQLKHDFIEVKTLLDDKIQDEIKFDRGRQKYDREVKSLQAHVDGLRQELEVEKKLSASLKAELRSARDDNEHMMAFKKRSDVQIAELSLKLSRRQQAAATGGSSSDEIEMLQTRLASESFENRQLRAKIKKLTGSSEPASMVSSVNSMANSVDSMRSSASSAPADDNELLMQRSANKRLEKLNVELQKELLQQKNLNREANDMEPLEDDYKIKWQIAQTRVEELEKRFKGSMSPLQDSTNLSLSTVEEDSNTSKESLIMRQENLRLSSRLNETQTKLKRLQLTSNASFEQQEEMAKIKSRLKMIATKNTSLQESVDFYKSRAENYYNKIEAAEVAVQSAKRARELTLNELNQTKERLEKAQGEFKISDANVAKLNASIREVERQLSDKTFELRKIQESYDALKEKFENAEELRQSASSMQSQSRDRELTMLNEDLLKSMNKETELAKQIKSINLQMDVSRKQVQSLKFNNSTLKKEKDQLSKLFREVVDSRDVLQRESKEYSMKVDSLTSQVMTLKTSNADLLQERDDLLLSKRTLEEKVAEISAEFDRYLEKAKVDASNAVNVVQLSEQLSESKKDIVQLRGELEIYKSNIEKSNDSMKQMRGEADMIVEENKALTKYNINLKSQLKDLQNKAETEMKRQDDHWQKRVQELEDKLYMSTATKRDDAQKVYNLERTIKDLQQHGDMQESTIKRYSEQVEYLEQTVSRLDRSITEMQKRDAENVLKLKRTIRESQDSKERALMLEKELLEWRASDVSLTRV